MSLPRPKFPAVVRISTDVQNIQVEKSKFSQIDPDQSQEWLNGTSKKADGIVGITRTASALSR